MGYSSYSDDMYKIRSDARADTAKKTGASIADTTFAYTADTISKPAADWKVADRLNPYGLKMREARDSKEHPETVAIGIMCDVTGSMHHLPRIFQEKLPALMGLLMRKGYIEHPSILFGAFGDATAGDRVPLQVGQFESGLEMDDDLTHLFLEGGGGGGNQESYQFAHYVFARHTSTDCWEKRAKKGYLFTIGDESYYPFVSKAEVERLIGVKLQADIPTKDLIAELRERYHVFHVIPAAGASWSGNPDIKHTWQELLGGQYVLALDDPHAVSETLALAIGISEGKIESEDDIGTHLKDVGADASVVAAAAKALAPLAKAGGGAVAATATGKLPDVPGTSSGTTRL